MINNILSGYGSRRADWLSAVLDSYKRFAVAVWLLVLCCFIMSTAGCSETFEPLQENDKYYFSVFGYLDASADTQWVRVMPVREDVFLEPKPMDATVTLEHVESGDVVVMKDSLFAFSHDVYAYNFWTTMELQPGQAYRINVEGRDGNFSRAEVILPIDFPTPMVRIDRERTGTPTLTTVFIQGVEQLADVRTLYGNVSIPHLKDTLRQSPDDFQILIDPQEDFDQIRTFYPGASLNSFIGTSSDAKIFVASAGPDYHPFGSVSEEVVALPKGVSNIENGTGYLGGIISKTVPFQTCVREGTADIIPCSLEPYPW